MNNDTLLSNYYTQHRAEIVGFIAIRTKDAESAQDMVQDLFLRLLSSRCLMTPQTLPHLIYTMASHAVVDYYRRRRVTDEYEHYLYHSSEADDSLESVFSARQMMERMEHSLARLSEECRTIYRLHIYDGMKVGDIAKELALPYKQVENRLGQARKTVRRQLRACL